MQVAANSIFAKTGRGITAGIRSTSCNGGWLQFFTHIVCGTFTVTSFVVILVLTFNISKEGTNVDESRCQLAGCRVICHEAPFYETFEDDIVLAVMTAEENCKNVILTLHEPRFTNESLPQNWLMRLRPVVVELSILGGNLHHIPQNAFAATFTRSLKLLIFEKITIASWTQHALLGLANLENISIKKCNIIDVQENFLSAVNQTLTTLSVVESGFWNPENLTGSSRLVSSSMLTSVYLTNNDFDGNLAKASFSRLGYCKSLYLDSNRISYIEPGAFNKLVNLEYLNLNDNLLTRIEPNLFNVMTSSPRPRVRMNLINNLWHCDCSDRELRRLTRLAVLLVDPTCSSPRTAQGKTFNEFSTLCRKNEPKQIVTVDMQRNTAEDEGPSIQNLECVSNISPKFTPKVVSPFHNYPCSVDLFNYSNSQNPSTIADFNNINGDFWVNPAVIFMGGNFTMIELSFSQTEGYGLIWYRNSCVNEVFCVNILPDTIRLYNIDRYSEYTFCPLVLTSGTVDSTQCIDVASKNTSRSALITKLILFPLVAIGCLFFGALTLYMLIRKYPFLLKGSKRLLFVKHKTVDALVLPPKVPLRGVQSDASLNDSKEILHIPVRLRHEFKRSSSVRSYHSSTPSYVSALQPTDEQLENWRLKHGNERFDNHYVSISTISMNSPVSFSSDSDHLYFSIEDELSIINLTDPFCHYLENEPVSVP